MILEETEGGHGALSWRRCNDIFFAVVVETSADSQRLSSLQGSSVALAQSVLAELPDQVASFFNSYNLKPPNMVSGSRPV